MSILASFNSFNIISLRNEYWSIRLAKGANSSEVCLMFLVKIAKELKAEFVYPSNLFE